MNNEIGKFGEYQRAFENAIRNNGRLIDTLLVDCMKSKDNSGQTKRIIKMSFIVNKSSAEVRFEENEGKSMTFIEMDLKNVIHELEPRTSFHPVDEECSKWVFKVLSMRNYKYKDVRIEFPSGYNTFHEPAAEIQTKKLEITVANDEGDPQIVNSWLSKFENGVEHMKITSIVANINLTANQCLQNSNGVTMFGKINIDTASIKSLRGKFFIYNGLPDKEFRAEQMLELAEHCFNFDGIRAISLRQTREANGKEVVEWTNNKYGGDQENEAGFIVQQGSRSPKRYFYVKNSATKVQFGKFETLEQARKDCTQWSQIFKY